MSETSRLYLELQEQANALGFESVEEATDSGYEIVGDQLVKSVETEMLEAHADWEMKKKEVVKGLKECRDGVYHYYKSDQQVLQEAIDFIEHDCEGRV